MSTSRKCHSDFEVNAAKQNTSGYNLHRTIEIEVQPIASKYVAASASVQKTIVLSFVLFGGFCELLVRVRDNW